MEGRLVALSPHSPGSPVTVGIAAPASAAAAPEKTLYQGTTKPGSLGCLWSLQFSELSESPTPEETVEACTPTDASSQDQGTTDVAAEGNSQGLQHPSCLARLLV